MQFVGCYLFLSHPYLNLHRFAWGYERLPFQTRLLMAPLLRWAQQSPWILHYASHLAMNGYFFSHGIGPSEVVEFWLDIPCVLIAGWVAVRIFQASSRRHLLGWLVYPLFLILCTVSCILHTVQNYRFVYDLPSLAFFSIGLYLIYFRKPRFLLVALFAIATLNRETTLFLIPFFLLSELTVPDNDETAPPALGPPVLPFRIPAVHRLPWKRLLRPDVVITATLLLAYWIVWHLFIFHFFRHNASEYYPRVQFNLYCFRRLRYWPQLFSACGFLLPLLPAFRKHVHNAQLRLWMWIIPLWYAVMFTWGILVETRVFAELLPFVAVLATLTAEESLAAAFARRQDAQQQPGERLPRAA
ncbi:MAG TPA: hypothetical protein VHX13_02290 [Acidobacteriaceae bacterium]|nr:hypothetical protein [Acidobacteriaceae bacterium]